MSWTEVILQHPWLAFGVLLELTWLLLRNRKLCVYSDKVTITWETAKNVLIEMNKHGAHIIIVNAFKNAQMCLNIMFKMHLSTQTLISLLQREGNIKFESKYDKVLWNAINVSRSSAKWYSLCLILVIIILKIHPCPSMCCVVLCFYWLLSDIPLTQACEKFGTVYTHICRMGAVIGFLLLDCLKPPVNLNGD